MKLFKPLIISLLLIVGYLILISYPYIFSKITRFSSLGILSLVEEQSVNIKKKISPDRRTDQFDNHLLKGEKVTVKLKASENNFGILLFRFAQLSSNVSDAVVFRIKEEGKEDWHYENNYKADQFQPDQYFTFGFPPFKNSKNNTYVFEIESLSGTYKNGIGVSLREPQVALVYKYTRNDLIHFNTLARFVFKKFIYAARNVSLLENWQLFIAFVFCTFLIVFLIEMKFRLSNALIYLANVKQKPRDISQKIMKSSPILFLLFIKKIKFTYSIFTNKIKKLSREAAYRFCSSRFYLLFFNTNTKKRIAVGLFIFLFAFLYRFSATDQLGVSSFYAGLGGQGDYDQFIRAATCSLKFCPAILGQNFLIESSILGTFYQIFGFAGGLKAYLYLMLILSSIVATLPYIILSRKNFLTVGGIIGGLFLATSDFLTYVALNLPPDNGSLFTFSMFFMVYLFTIHIGTIRWLLFLGLAGTIDGLNKLILLPNDIAALILFIPVFLYEKAKRINKFPFVKLNPKLIFCSMLPFLVFFLIYSSWEHIVQMKFSRPYYLRSLVETGGFMYATSNDVGTISLKENFSKGNILEIFYYYGGLTIVFLKRIIDNSGFNTILFIPILFGLLFATFKKSTPIKSGSKFFIRNLISILLFGGVTTLVLTLFKGNFLDIQKVGMYAYAWSNDIYVNVFIFSSIIFLFILNFRYLAFKLALPIIAYVIMLITFAKNVSEVRMLVHVIVWNIILFSFLTDWILNDFKKGHGLKKLPIGPILLALFILFYSIPKTENMAGKLYLGVIQKESEIKYLRWVNQELPSNAIILAGGESDLVSVTENIKKPIIYNTMWTSALLIKSGEIPKVKPTDFAILDQLEITEMKGITPSDFSLIQELKNKDNFRKNTYLILEDDIDIWRARMAGVYDSVFAEPSSPLLHPSEYSIKVYKSNSALSKSIYELKLKVNEGL